VISNFTAAEAASTAGGRFQLEVALTSSAGVEESNHNPLPAGWAVAAASMGVETITGEAVGVASLMGAGAQAETIRVRHSPHRNIREMNVIWLI
jgi:hypothetical protein